MTEQDKEDAKLPIQTTEVTTDDAEKSEETAQESVSDSKKKTLKERLAFLGFFKLKRMNWRWVKRSLLILVILLTPVLIVYWLWTLYDSDVSGLKQQQQVLLSNLEVSQNQIAALQKLNAQSKQEWQQSMKRLEDLVVASAQRWNRESNRTESRWPLEEALTLARLAEQRLQLDSSAKVATGLLKSADQVLAGLDQAAVLPIRRQLAEDILALESTPSTDINGQYFALEAIAKDIEEFNWVPKPITHTALDENISPAQGFWQSIKKVVVITRLSVPMKAPALQSDFERWRQRQLLLIEQVQLALLAHNQPLYDSALKQALSTLNIMQSQFSIDAMQAQLVALQSSVLNPQWPDISASVAALELYISEQPIPATEGAQ